MIDKANAVANPLPNYNPSPVDVVIKYGIIAKISTPVNKSDVLRGKSSIFHPMEVHLSLYLYL